MHSSASHAGDRLGQDRYNGVLQSLRLRIVCWRIVHGAHATRSLVRCQRILQHCGAGMRERRSWARRNVPHS